MRNESDRTGFSSARPRDPKRTRLDVHEQDHTRSHTYNKIHSQHEVPKERGGRSGINTLSVNVAIVGESSMIKSALLTAWRR